MKYKERNSTLEAHCWNGDWKEMQSWAAKVSDGSGCSLRFREVNNLSCLRLDDIDGESHVVNLGDYIVCRWDGSWVWFDGKTFEAQYEAV